MEHLSSVLTNIRHHPKRWLPGIVIVIIGRLVEERLLAWVNKCIDEGAVFLMPQIRDLLKAIVEHPWLSLFVVAAAYSIIVVVIAHISVLGGVRGFRWPWAFSGPTLEFGAWHGGTASGYPSNVYGLVPSWLSIRNTEIKSPEAARNVTARLEWTNPKGTAMFPVPEAEWYERQGPPGRRTTESWNTSATIEGGDEQSFILILQDDRGRDWVYKRSNPVGVLDYGHWQAKLVVASDNAKGFEATLGFTLTRSEGLKCDQPFFVMQRRVKSRLRP